MTLFQRAKMENILTWKFKPMPRTRGLTVSGFAEQISNLLDSGFEYFTAAEKQILAIARNVIAERGND